MEFSHQRATRSRPTSMLSPPNCVQAFSIRRRRSCRVAPERSHCFMVSSTIRTARSLSSGGCRCPDPCLGVCFGADVGSILPKNRASIKPQGSSCPLGNCSLNLLGAAEHHHVPRFITFVAAMDWQFSRGPAAIVGTLMEVWSRLGGERARRLSDANALVNCNSRTGYLMTTVASQARRL